MLCAAVCMSCACDVCCVCVLVGVGVGVPVCSGGGVHVDGAGLGVSASVCMCGGGALIRSGLMFMINSSAISLITSSYVGRGVVYISSSETTGGLAMGSVFNGSGLACDSACVLLCA